MSLLASRCLTSCNVGEDPGFDVIENFYMIERHKLDTASLSLRGPSEPKINPYKCSTSVRRNGPGAEPNAKIYLQITGTSFIYKELPSSTSNNLIHSIQINTSI